MTGFLIAAACVAVALLHAFRLAVPPRRDLVTAVDRWDQARARASRIQRIGTPEHPSFPARLMGRLADHLSHPGPQSGRQSGRHLGRQWGRQWDLTRLNQDLAITGSTLEAHLTRILTLAAAGLVGPVVAFTLLEVAGLRLPGVVGPAAGVLLAGSMVPVVQRELAENATTRRAEFRRTLSIYLDLVAMSLQAGRGHAEALPAAAAIGTGPAFTDLQDAIDGARFSGITAWAALGRLGDQVGVPELSDLEGALALAADDGAKVKATLIARAGTLRAQRVADAEATANQATESMKFALIVMVFVFLTYEVYPAIARLFTG